MIVIPMAGLSSRFYNAGYSVPKYKLPIPGGCVFTRVLKGFKSQFKIEPFLFITMDKYNDIDFIATIAESLGVENFEIICLENPTRGQADTVYQGLHAMGARKSRSLTIFNIDTFRNDITVVQKEIDTHAPDGLLEVFIGSGENWSNVIPINDRRVLRTSEKQNESHLCSTGLYYFKSAEIFCSGFERYESSTSTELYIAPLYNVLIEDLKTIHYCIVDNTEIIHCGTPIEYESYCRGKINSP